MSEIAIEENHATEACQANPGFEVTLTGGDGDGIQLCESIFS